MEQTSPRPWMRWLLAAGVALAGVAQANEAPRYRVLNLGTLEQPRSSSVAVGINDDGLLTGTLFGGPAGAPRAFVGTGAQDLLRLGTLGGPSSVAKGLNDRGDVVGWSIDAEGQRRPFLYQGGRMLDLAPAARSFSDGVANAVNATGQVTGQLGAHAFFFDGTRTQELRVGLTSEGLGLNDLGAVVGGAVRAGDVVRSAFVHQDGKTTWLPSLGGTYGQAYAVNNAGQVVGYSYTAAGELLPFLYQDGKMTALADSGFGQAFDINERGWVVGDQDLNAFLYRDGRLHNLNDLVAPDQAGRWTLVSASGINDAGVIVGYGLFHGYLRGFVATPVPEPQAWALMLAGLGVVGAAARRRRRAAQRVAGSAS